VSHSRGAVQYTKLTERAFRLMQHSRQLSVTIIQLGNPAPNDVRASL